MEKKVNPENNCENCFRKKYCSKPCSASLFKKLEEVYNMYSRKLKGISTIFKSSIISICLNDEVVNYPYNEIFECALDTVAKDEDFSSCTAIIKSSDEKELFTIATLRHRILLKYFSNIIYDDEFYNIHVLDDIVGIKYSLK